MPRAKTQATPLHPVVTDKEAIAAAAAYTEKRAEMKALGVELDALKDTIMAAMTSKDAKAATQVFGNHLVTRKDVAALPATKPVKITVAMVDQVIPGKKGKAGYSFIEVQ